jgi:methionyl-tRNA formyltransferase
VPSLGRLLFFGTPAFAVPSLAALCAAGRSPLAVITQPARPAGRGRQTEEPPVARWALRHGLPVRQPEKVRGETFLREVALLEPDLAVVVAFGQIFPRALLDLPRQGCVNVHASLLPKFRGAAPVQAAIATGETATGVTTMLMDEGLDTGPILLQRTTSIAPEETGGALAARLAELGADLLVETLERLEVGDLQPRPQEAEGASYAPRLGRADGRVDWSLPAPAIAARLRAFDPWPGACAVLGGEEVKLLAARPLASGAAAYGEAGTILGLRGGLLAVRCGDGTVLGIELLQRPGRRPLPAAAFANGARLRGGERFG